MAAPVLISGVAVQRSILVSDATISPIGFARFLDSFTNTTGAAITITVETRTNSGADHDFAFSTTTSGDGSLTAADTGFVTTGGGDTVAMIAYGDGRSTSRAPSTTSIDQSGNDGIITVTHTLTLQPGETQSLLQFATQNDTGNENLAGLDLNAFTGSAVNLAASGFLAGLSRAEQLSIVNYSGFDQVVDPFELRDSNGNLWTIDNRGQISTGDTAALTDSQLPTFSQNFTTPVSVSTGAAENTVTVVKSLPGAPLTTVTYEYAALEDQGVIRLLVTMDLTAADSLDLPDFVATGQVANGANLVAQHLNPGNRVTGMVVDDSISGSGGALPAVTVVGGNQSLGAPPSLSGSTLGFN